jgi:hypothetical protein
MSGWKFNPLTGQLDRVVLSEAGGLTYGKLELVADASLVLSKTFILDGEPMENSEQFFLNGLAQDSSCYTLTANILTLDGSFPLRVGDQIIINYAY